MKYLETACGIFIAVVCFIAMLLCLIYAGLYLDLATAGKEIPAYMLMERSGKNHLIFPIVLGIMMYLILSGISFYYILKNFVMFYIHPVLVRLNSI